MPQRDTASSGTGLTEVAAVALTGAAGLPALFATVAQLAGHALAAPTPGLAVAAALLAATVAAGVLAAVLAPAARATRAPASGPLVSRAAALREKSWCAAFLRQRDPDAPGRARPRAPSAAPGGRLIITGREGVPGSGVPATACSAPAAGQRVSAPG